MKRLFILILFPVLILSNSSDATVPGIFKTEEAERFSETEEKSQILKRLKEMETTFLSGKFEDLADFYSDSAIISGKGTEISGREAIQNYWKNLEGRGESWELESIEIRKLGDIYLQRGISRMGIKHNNKVVQANSKFSLVWIMENGEWVIFLDHYSPLN